MKSFNDISIQLIHVSKTYIIHHEKPTLVEKFFKGRNERFIALNNIGFTLRKGDRVGIIGSNGSGKTTLLKIISGITSPTSGQVKTYGRVVSLIDLNAGFHPELSGYQNIFINGMLLGLSKKYITKNIREIIHYADIKQFIDAPLYTYSSGMILRLGFSIAVQTMPEILILDENMNVGDLTFQNKARDTIQNLLSRKVTLLMASHNFTVIKKLCSKIFFLEKGALSIGNLEMLGAYNMINRSK
jgi:ABC-type polysaccharide/polyol phosphate transport system ATPase subunit